MKKILLLLVFSLSLWACNSKTPLPEEAKIPERIEISPQNAAIVVGQNQQFEAKFFDNTGKEVTPTPTISWRSLNSQIAVVDAKGKASAVGVGQTQIEASYAQTSASTLFNVLNNTNNDGLIATISIEPENIELLPNQRIQLLAIAKNIDGKPLSNKKFSWQSQDNSILEIDNNAVVTAKSLGTSQIIATSEGVQSLKTEVAVVRKGAFSGKNNYTAKGDAILKMQSGKLQLVFDQNFSSSNGPDLRVYLSNGNNDVKDAIELAALKSTNGRQVYSIAQDVSFKKYRYAVIWCKQFSVSFGVADLGE